MTIKISVVKNDILTTQEKLLYALHEMQGEGIEVPKYVFDAEFEDDMIAFEEDGIVITLVGDIKIATVLCPICASLCNRFQTPIFLRVTGDYLQTHLSRMEHYTYIPPQGH